MPGKAEACALAEFTAGNDIGIWPLWICPVRQMAERHATDAGFGFPVTAQGEGGLMFNVGVYGQPAGGAPFDPVVTNQVLVSDGNQEQDGFEYQPDVYHVWKAHMKNNCFIVLCSSFIALFLGSAFGHRSRTNQTLEREVSALGGRKMMYAQSFYTLDEFWRLFDRRAYEGARKRFGAVGVFPDVPTKALLGEARLDSMRGVKAVSFASVWRPMALWYASLWAELLLPRAWHAALGVLFTGEQPYVSVDAAAAATQTQTAAATAKAPVAAAVGKAPKSPRAVRAKK